MNENRSKRREWVKSAAIVFLSILLVLTFFSQTILNHSLPEVATKNIQGGSITSKIRGGGTVESGDPYTVEVPANYVGRKVTSINVRTGDKVKKGDVIMTLADGDGSDLTNAKENLKIAQDTLKAAQDAYDDAILNAGITSSDIKSANANTSAATYRKMITDLQNQLQAAKDKVTPLETGVSQLTQAISDCSTQLGYEDQKAALAANKVANAQTVELQATNAQTAASDAYNAAQAERDQYQSQLDTLDAEYAADETSHPDYETERAALVSKLSTADATLTSKKSALDAANDKLKKAQEDREKAVKEQEEQEASPISLNVSKLKYEYEAKLYDYEKQLTAARAEVDRIQGELNDLMTKITDVTNLQSLQDRIDAAKKDVNEKKKKVEELEGENAGSQITAEISGTVTAINVSSGKTIDYREVMVLQPEGQGYYMSFSVTNEQARTVSVGDKASLVNSWYYNDMDITLKSIKPDKQEPAKKKMLTFNVDGDVTTGQTINVSIGSRSQNYDLIVPKSALRNDQNGDYILIVESKSSPLGNRYIATRVDIKILASDDTQAAISGALNGWEYVITTASAPIEAGSQVRMTDN